MPGRPDAPLARWGDELRRRRSRSGARRLWAGAAAIASAASLSTLAWPARPAFVWNASASAPKGLYHVRPAEKVEPGAVVVTWAPARVRRLAAERRYLPLNVPLVKHVAAAAGDRVCAAGEAVFVNGQFLALRRIADELGRPLPWWTGCRDLRSGELFLLMPGAPDSFDGRYFGVSRAGDLVGQARLLWRY